jgi:cardiolipin synthase
MLNVPNAITLLRIALIPPLALLLRQGDFATALVLFVISALSDLADGMIARRWNLRTRFGAIADPVADKLTMLVVTVSLALGHALPWWFAAAVVARDLLIVSGAIGFQLLIGRVEIVPSLLSKFNTALEFLLLASVMAVGAGIVEGGTWLRALMLTTLFTIVVSGAHYGVVWGRKAARARGVSS